MKPALPGTVALMPGLEVPDFSRSLEFYVRVIEFTISTFRASTPCRHAGIGGMATVQEGRERVVQARR
jgi:hypothetical protein